MCSFLNFEKELELRLEGDGYVIFTPSTKSVPFIIIRRSDPLVLLEEIVIIYHVLLFLLLLFYF